MTSGGSTSGRPYDSTNEEFWRKYLENPDSLQTIGRHLFSRLPAEPRCQLCAAPFEGAGGRVMRLIGKRRSDGNPNMCNTCQKVLIKHHGGAEVTSSMVFADIRGSTSMAEHMTPGEFRALLDRFYTQASQVVFAHSGVVDKFVGDELVAVYPPVYGARHAESAVATATDLLRVTGHADPGGPWAPVGVGVHTGPVWFGAIGEGEHTEITMVGDAVNTTARLASKAATGEILVSTDAAREAGLDQALEHRILELKGKEAATEVVVLKVGPV